MVPNILFDRSVRNLFRSLSDPLSYHIRLRQHFLLLPPQDLHPSPVRTLRARLEPRSGAIEPVELGLPLTIQHATHHHSSNLPLTFHHRQSPAIDRPLDHRSGLGTKKTGPEGPVHFTYTK